MCDASTWSRHLKPPQISWSAYRRALLIGALLIGHVVLLAWGAVCHSPTVDELGHLPAGLSHWMLGRGDLYRVNPPLVRMIATLPVLACNPQIDWSHYSTDSNRRSDFDVGQDFIEVNSDRFPWLFTVARWACIPFSLIGGLTCWIWSRKLYGSAAGIVAIILWCTCPNILAHGQLMTPDVGAAALGILATYTFWYWLKKSTWLATVSAGITLGLAELTKTSWIVLFLLWPLLAIFWNYAQPRVLRTQLISRVCKMAIVLLLALYVLNLGYAFEGSFSSLGEYQFVSRALRGDSANTDEALATGNRFAGTSLRSVPVPLPRNYVQGVDYQRRLFEIEGWSYLRGQVKKGGWYHYYLYAMLIKVPLGTWMIALMAIVVSLAPSRWFVNADDIRQPADDCATTQRSVPMGSPERSGWRDEVILLAPAVVVFLLVSSQTGFNRHLRYVLPIFPFLFVWVSKAGRYIGPGVVRISRSLTVERSTRRYQCPARGALAAIVIASLTWSACSSLQVYPHSLSYFNELVGGPTQGHLHLGDSNVDWGQDLWYLKKWHDEHPSARPLHLALHMTDIDPRLVGIHYESVPRGPVMNRLGAKTTSNWPWTDRLRAGRGSSFSHVDHEEHYGEIGPLPGWFVVSANVLHRPDGEYEYFQEFEPVDRIGYSMNVYHITLADANRLRRKLGLSWLDDDS